MITPRTKALWIAFPILVTAVSILGVTRLRKNQSTAVPAATQDATVPPGQASYTPPSQPVTVTIPANTPIVVRLDQSLATNRAYSGEAFSATVSEPVVIDGQTVIPEGSSVRGRVLSDKKAGRLHGVAHMRLALDSVELNGSDYEIHTDSVAERGRNHNKHNAEMIGGGIGGGALLGALVGGGKGALIGLPIGAGAGVAGAAFTGKKNFVIPAETRFTFQLREPVELQLRS